MKRSPLNFLLVADTIPADLLLSAPERRRTELNDTIRRRMAKYFPVVTGNAFSARGFEKNMPQTAQKWLKLQITGGGDTMRGAEDASASISNTEGRDNSFVRVSSALNRLLRAEYTRSLHYFLTIMLATPQWRTTQCIRLSMGDYSTSSSLT